MLRAMVLLLMAMGPETGLTDIDMDGILMSNPWLAWGEEQ